MPSRNKGEKEKRLQTFGTEEPKTNKSGKTKSRSILFRMKKDSKNRMGVFIRTPNYLSIYHLKTSWGKLLFKEVDKQIIKKVRLLLKAGLLLDFIEMQRNKVGAIDDNTEGVIQKPVFDRTPLSPTCIVPYPKITPEAKSWHYKCMDDVGQRVVLGYAEHRKRQDQKVVGYDTVLRQMASIHGVQRTKKMVEKYGRVYDKLVG